MALFVELKLVSRAVGQQKAVGHLKEQGNDYFCGAGHSSASVAYTKVSFHTVVIASVM
jgi:hypothetical protein